MPRPFLAALLFAACSAPPPKPPATGIPEAVPSVAPERDPNLLPAMTPAEAEIAKQLDAELSGLLAIGERAYYADGLPLADATDYVVGRLESFGYEVKRKGFTHDDTIAQNIEVEVPGLRRGHQVVVVSARLDSAKGSVGADDNATGVAGLLVLAHRFRDQRALRTLRFVFFSSAGPRDQREAQGAYHYARSLRSEEAGAEAAAAAAEQAAAEAEAAAALSGSNAIPESEGTTGFSVVATVELRGLGVFDVRPGSQRYPENVIASDDNANFIALVSLTEGAELAAATGSGFESKGSVPLEHWVLLRDDAFFAGSAAFEFMDQGFQPLVFTDTQAFRTDKLGTKADTAETLDRERMARVVFALEPALMELSGPRGEAREPDPSGLSPGASTAPAPSSSTPPASKAP